jgi:tetratricopeptide (TPR) repeat protein/predicted Ser/Thr protein kinase
MTDLPAHIAAALPRRYTVERVLARGGMATVYLAREHQPERVVALKVLDPVATAHVARERFLHEIDVVSKLTHPTIVPVFAAGQAADTLYYVMPYVEGESLRARLEREACLTVADALAIVRDVADALEYAHRRGIIHRDIKPENILLHEGRAFVTDFGVARALDVATGPMTAEGIAVGTPAYMSPEQVRGEVDPTPQSDVYALACVVYEMLTGEPPFRGRTAQAIMQRHLADTPPPLRTLRAAVPVTIERVVLRALEKAPADRPPSAAAFARDLEQSAEHPALPGPAPRSRPRVLAWWAAAAAGIVAAAVGAEWWDRRQQAAARSAQAADDQEIRGHGDAFHREGQVWLGLRTADGLQRAIAAFDSAIARDSGFAAAYADLSKAYSLAMVYRYRLGVPTYEAAARALALANRAIELDRSLPAAYEARAYVASRTGGPLDLIRGDFREAARLNPGSAEALSWSALVAGQEGRTEEALARARQAIALQPRSPPRHIALAMEALRAGRNDLAVEEARHAQRLDPRLLLARGFELRGLLAAGRAAECLAVPSGPHAGLHAACLWEAGRRAEARSLVDSLARGMDRGTLRDTTFTDALRAEDLATYFAWTGDAATALHWLRRAFDASPLGVEPRVLNSPLFDRVRRDPAFAAGAQRAVREAWERVWRASRAP